MDQKKVPEIREGNEILMRGFDYFSKGEGRKLRRIFESKQKLESSFWQEGKKKKEKKRTVFVDVFVWRSLLRWTTHLSSITKKSAGQTPLER